MARNTYGLDLGSYEIKVYDKKERYDLERKRCNCDQRQVRRFSLSEMMHMACMRKHRTTLMLYFQ